MKDAPFIKYKKVTATTASASTHDNNNNTNNNNINKKSSTLLNDKNNKNNNNKQDKTEKEYIRNRFICRGKLVNFSFIQKQEQKNKMNSFQTKYTENLSSEHKLQKTVLNYRDYIKTKLS